MTKQKSSSRAVPRPAKVASREISKNKPDHRYSLRREDTRPESAEVQEIIRGPELKKAQGRTKKASVAPKKAQKKLKSKFFDMEADEG